MNFGFEKHSSEDEERLLDDRMNVHEFSLMSLMLVNNFYSDSTKPTSLGVSRDGEEATKNVYVTTELHHV